MERSEREEADVEAVLAALCVGGALLVWWALASRRHVRRREQAAADWTDAGDVRPDLWTSGARCPHCFAHGGLLELIGDELWFTCLACNQRHARGTRG